MIRALRRYLGFKIFLSYLIVISIEVIVLISAAEFAVSTAFERHLAAMSILMGGAETLEADLFNNFRAAVTEMLALATAVSAGAAVFLSLLVSRQVVAPVREMMLVSRRIAEGNYRERVHIPMQVRKEELDELAQLAVSFNQMAARLEQTESMRRQLIGDVAHELRTPLTAIKGSMEGLIDGVLPADPQTFEQIYREADRLARLVSDLQELSRVESGALPMNRRAVDLTEAINATRTRLIRQFEEKEVELNVNLPADSPRVYADEDRLGQILLNLIGNALQYTPSGGKVTVQAKVTQGEIEIAVADTGIGISAAHLPHLFDRFYRVDKSRSRAGGGSGIGLTIAKHLVEAQGGRIWVESEGEGKGSTFRFTLPRAH